jgi:hypothetical protein
MMTPLSYFLAHALCERFPINDNDFRALDPLPALPAVPDTASSHSASSANKGTSRTHAKTGSQATVKGPVDTAIMVRVYSAKITCQTPTPPLISDLQRVRFAF